MYDEGYWERRGCRARKELDELLSMGDSELINLLEGIPEEETMRALGYTKKEGISNEAKRIKSRR